MVKFKSEQHGGKKKKEKELGVDTCLMLQQGKIL